MERQARKQSGCGVAEISEVRVERLRAWWADNAEVQVVRNLGRRYDVVEVHAGGCGQAVARRDHREREHERRTSGRCARGAWTG